MECRVLLVKIVVSAREQGASSQAIVMGGTSSGTMLDMSSFSCREPAPRATADTQTLPALLPITC